jgi:hypothetical protein
MGIEPTSEAWELSETATSAPVSVRTNMPIRKERYWLRNRELVHGAKMYVMPQLGVRISWRERRKPGPRHHACCHAKQIPRSGSDVGASLRCKRDFLHVLGDLRSNRHRFSAEQCLQIDEA